MLLGARKVLLGAVTLAAVACGSGPGDGPADVSGRWAMFAFEDPVAVDIQQAGDVLGGRGCCGGLGADQLLSCCGDVSGQIEGRRASFGFSFDVAEPYDYSTNAYVSADGGRMAGTFSRVTFPVAWVRIGPSDRWLPEPVRALTDILLARSGRYDLALADAPGAGSDFSAQQLYAFGIADRFVYGMLGSYWDGEMSWTAGEQTLALGPVPETAPGLPVALRLRFDGTTLASVEATMASGLRYTFQAVASQP